MGLATWRPIQLEVHVGLRRHLDLSVNKEKRVSSPMGFSSGTRSCRILLELELSQLISVESVSPFRFSEFRVTCGDYYKL